MIALLAAVPEETRLVRQTCRDLQRRDLHGLSLWEGTYQGSPLCLAHGGIGKAAAAVAATTLLLHYKPAELWLFGCGGAYPSSGLTIGDLALASLEVFGDEGVESAEGFQSLVDMELPMRQDPNGPMYNAWPIDKDLNAWATQALCGASPGKTLKSGPFLTVSSCTGTTAQAREREGRTGAICENMEGAAVALACHQFATPFLELRGISNLVEDRDLGRWDLAAGMRAAQETVLLLLDTRTAR